nr:hypothetical protein CPGR_02507 [Mycolicibacterium komanii]
MVVVVGVSVAVVVVDGGGGGGGGAGRAGDDVVVVAADGAAARSSPKSKAATTTATISSTSSANPIRTRGRRHDFAGPAATRASRVLSGSAAATPRWWLRALAKSAQRSNRSFGFFDSALASTGSNFARSGRCEPIAGGAADRCWLITTAGLELRNGGEPVRR